MNKPTVDEVLAGLSASRDEDTEEPNRYTAAMVTAKRARQINSYFQKLREGGGPDGPLFPPAADTFTRNYLSVSMAEAARGEVSYRLRSSRL